MNRAVATKAKTDKALWIWALSLVVDSPEAPLQNSLVTLTAGGRSSQRQGYFSSAPTMPWAVFVGVWSQKPAAAHGHGDPGRC